MNQYPPNYHDINECNSKMESYIDPSNSTIQYPPSAPPPPNILYNSNIQYTPSAPAPPNIQHNSYMAPSSPPNQNIQDNSYMAPSSPPNQNIQHQTIENIQETSHDIMASSTNLNIPNSNIIETNTTRLNQNEQPNYTNRNNRSSNQNELNIYPSLDRIEESNSVRLVVPTITNFNSTEEYIGNQFNSETCSFILNNINNKLKEKYLVSNWEYDKSKNINYICVWTTNHLLLAKINIIFYNSQETDAIIPYNLNFRIETDIDVFIKTNWSKIDQENKKLIQQSFILENNNILSVLLSEMSSILKQLSPKKSKFRDLFSQCLGEG